MFEVIFKVTYNSFYIDISRKYPSFKMFSWCNHDYDINEILVENQDEYKLIIDDINKQKLDGIFEESSDQQKLHLMVSNCSCNIRNSVSMNIRDLHILNISPSVIEKGWEYNRVIIYCHEDFEELIQRLNENGFTVEILRKVPYNGIISSSLTLTTDTLLSNLTQRQVDALLTAHRYGYYKLPRRTDIQTISIKEQVARTTFQEHLKKAENKIIEALVPYIIMFKLNISAQRKSK